MESIAAGTDRGRAQAAVGRAAVLTKPGVTAVVRQAFAEPGPGQVRVRLEGCGVCGSNLPVWEGRPWFAYPLAPGAPGHEGWGTIDATGPGVFDVAVGDRVAVLSDHAFAEFDIADATAVVPLPDALADSPFPGEALGCALNVFRRASIEAGQTVAVIGIGFLGALLVQLAARAGARVIAVSRRPFALSVARACGAADTVPLTDRDPTIAQLAELTGGLHCDRVIEATGEQLPLDIAGAVTRERGRLVIAGFHQDGSRHIDMFLWNWRGLDVINAHERRPAAYVRGMRDAVAAVSSGVLDPAPLYTHRFPLDRAGAALAMLRQRPDGFLKALVVP